MKILVGNIIDEFDFKAVLKVISNLWNGDPIQTKRQIYKFKGKIDSSSQVAFGFRYFDTHQFAFFFFFEEMKETTNLTFIRDFGVKIIDKIFIYKIYTRRLNFCINQHSSILSSLNPNID